MAKKNEYSVNQDGVCQFKVAKAELLTKYDVHFFTKKFNLNFRFVQKIKFSTFSFIPLLFIFVITYFPISNIILLTKNKLRK